MLAVVYVDWSSEESSWWGKVFGVALRKLRA